MSMFDVTRVSADVGDSQISFETGKLAKQAGGAVVVQAGDTMVLCTATVGSLRDVDFLPLTVDVEERMYAAGKIPGSFFRREGKSGEKATLTARMIDRPIRPLFPKGWHYETQLVAIPMSVDQVHPYDILAMNGASAALAISPVPVAAHVGAVRIGKLDGDFVVNPAEEDHEELDLDLIVAGTDEAILMVEAGANGVTEAGDPRRPRHRPRRDQEARRRDGGAAAEGRQGEDRGRGARRSTRACSSEIRSSHGQALVDAIATEGKLERYEAIDKVKDEVVAKYAPESDDGEADDEARGRGQGRLRRDREGHDPQGDRRRQEAPRRPRPGRDPADRVRGRHLPARARLGAVHPRRDPDPLQRRARHDAHGHAHRHARPGDHEDGSGTTTTSRPSRSGRPASCAARSAATSATARSPSGPWWRRSRTKRTSPT